MSSYYDYLGEKGTLGADLTRFDPKVRLTASGNQEGTVYFTDVNLDLELDPAGGWLRLTSACCLTFLPRNVLTAVAVVEAGKP
jgi:hypothetical protein